MHSCMFLSSFDASLGWSKIFGLALNSAALLVVGGRGGFSSHIFPGVSIKVGYLPIMYLFIFTIFFPTPWLFWGVPLSIVFVRSFPEEAQKLSANFLSLSIYARAAEVFSSAQFSRRYPQFLPGCQSSDCLSGVTSVGSRVSHSSLWWRGIQTFWSDWFNLVKLVLIILLPSFY